MLNKSFKFQIYCILDINSTCLANTDTEDILPEIDKSSFIFWNGNKPSLEYVKTDKITYRGENVLDIRKDINIVDLLFYIQASYR